ncbi:hypothetical protein PHISP_08270, partial [Aspergillus sp. HF37]
FDGRIIRVDHASDSGNQTTGFRGRGGYNTYEGAIAHYRESGPYPFDSRFYPRFPSDVESIPTWARSSPVEDGGGCSTTTVPKGEDSTDQANRLQGVMTFDWELPLLIERYPSFAYTDTVVERHPSFAYKDRASTDSFLRSITLVASGDFVELMTCRQYLEMYHPGRGVKLVEFVINTLTSSSDVAGKYFQIILDFFRWY